jgi:hypothetical protein
MAERRTAGPVRIEIGSRNTAHLFGDGLVPVLEELGIPHMRDPYRRRVRCCPADRVDDLLALLEHRDRRSVEVVAVLR